MNFQLTYAGVTFRLLDAESMEQVEKVYALADLADILPSAPVYPGANLLRLCPPRPVTSIVRLGEYGYPTGATRFSVFRCLVHQGDAAAMSALAFAGSVSVPQTFTMQSEAIAGQGSISASLYLLPPRPVFIPGSAFHGMYLITLVDERYYWQFRSAPAINGSDGNSDTWANLLGYLATSLGITLTIPTINSLYGQPESDSALYSNYESAAVLLDAVAANVGCVVVRNLNGTYQLQSYATAQADAVSNRPGSSYWLAGGSIFNTNPSTADPFRMAVVPASITVTFPQWVNNVGYYEPGNYRSWAKMSYGAVFSEVLSPATLGTPYSGYGTHPGTVTLRTTAKALYSTTPTGSPTNASSCLSLAKQLATDWIDHNTFTFDEVYRGIHPIVPCGAYDILWRFTNTPSTRVQRQPTGWGAIEFQHSFGLVQTPTTTVNLVTNDCPILSSGVQTGSVIEFTPVTLPTGAVLGTPYCEVNPIGCCPEGDVSDVLLASWTNTDCTTCPLTSPVTLPAVSVTGGGLLLVVFAQGSCSAGTTTYTCTFNGTSMAQAVVFANAALGNAIIFYLYVASDATGNAVISAASGGFGPLLLTAIEVFGLTHNAPYATSTNYGLFSAPTLGALAASSTLPTYTQAVFNAGAPGYAWASPMVDGVNITGCGELTEGFVHRAAGGASVTPNLTGITPSNWFGAGAAFY